MTDAASQLVATRAYELCEQQGRRDGQSAQNREKAEQEIRATQTKPQFKVETKPAVKAESVPEAKAQTNPDDSSKPAAKTEPAPEVKAPAKPEATAVPPSAVKAEPKPDTKTDVKTTDKVEPKPDGKAETKPETNVKPAAEVSPQLVQRVYKFYEQLGREDVRAVQESDEAERKIQEEESRK